MEKPTGEWDPLSSSIRGWTVEGDGYRLVLLDQGQTFKNSRWLQGDFLGHPTGLRPQDLPDTLIEAPASMIPLLGLTQYLRGAVVFTLKHTFRSVGLPSFRLVVTTSVKGPVE